LIDLCKANYLFKLPVILFLAVRQKRLRLRGKHNILVVLKWLLLPKQLLINSLDLSTGLLLCLRLQEKHLFLMPLFLSDFIAQLFQL
jgi:hypothetical protein